MAITNAYQTFDMSIQSAHSGNVVEDSPTRIVFQQGDQRTVYLGWDLQVSPGGDVAGTLTGVEQYNSDGIVYEIWDLNSNATDFYSAIQTRGNWTEAAQIGLVGDDSFYGSRQDDRVWGGTGHDWITGGSGNDHLTGGYSPGERVDHDGDDMVFGNAGHDVLNGGSGNDSLYGGGGRDVLRGGTGNDYLSGGGGSDRFVFGDDSDSDLVRGFNANRNSEDIDLSNVSAISSFRDLSRNHMQQEGRDVIIDDGDNTRIILLNVDLDDLGRGDFIF